MSDSASHNASKSSLSETIPDKKLEPKQIALHALHLEQGARMVNFAGWRMPLQYPTGIMGEHRQCREQVALFDVSHMGQLLLQGPSSDALLETLVPADITNLRDGACRYTFLTNESGGILDDLIITRTGDSFYIVVNASMCAQDIAHLQTHLSGQSLIHLDDQSLLAIQGPCASEVLQTLCSDAQDLTFMSSMETTIRGITCRVSRLGYTGEDGFELSMANEHADVIARLLLADKRCAPVGLGARDSLRLEAGLCLYGNDIDQNTSPVEAGLQWAIPKRRRVSGGFPGDEIIMRQLEVGTDRMRVGIQVDGKVPARQGTLVCDLAGQEVGSITSGCFGPTANAPVAMGYVAAALAQPGTQLILTIRGKQHPATVSKLPFVPHRYYR